MKKIEVTLGDKIAAWVEKSAKEFEITPADQLRNIIDGAYCSALAEAQSRPRFTFNMVSGIAGMPGMPGMPGAPGAPGIPGLNFVQDDFIKQNLRQQAQLGILTCSHCTQHLSVADVDNNKCSKCQYQVYNSNPSPGPDNPGDNPPDYSGPNDPGGG